LFAAIGIIAEIANMGRLPVFINEYFVQCLIIGILQAFLGICRIEKLMSLNYFIISFIGGVS